MSSQTSKTSALDEEELDERQKSVEVEATESQTTWGLKNI